MPKVSVVMPCYNHAEYVAEAIEGVLRQTYTDFEFFVFDNGSIDNSWEVIQQFEDERLHKIRLEKNDMLEVKKQFIHRAKGEYVALAYSDDYWLENKLEKQIDFMERNKDIKLSFTWAESVDENLQRISKMAEHFHVRNRTQEEWLELIILRGNYLPCPAAVFQKDMYIKYFGRLYPYRQIADMYCWLNMLFETKIHVVEEVLLLQRIHDAGENRNESTPTKTNMRRYRLEIRHMTYDVIDKMSDDWFVRSFRNHFFNKNINNHMEVLCEKFFFFMKMASQDKNYEDNVVRFYNQYFDYEEDGIWFYQYLDKKYHFSRKDFFDYTGQIGANVDMLRDKLIRWQLLEQTDFHTIKYPTQLIIYGLGYIGNAFYNKIKAYCKVELFIDKKPKREKLDGIPIVPLDNIKINKGCTIVVVPSYDFEGISKEILEKSRYKANEVDIVRLEDFLKNENVGK